MGKASQALQKQMEEMAAEGAAEKPKRSPRVRAKKDGEAKPESDGKAAEKGARLRRVAAKPGSTQMGLNTPASQGVVLAALTHALETKLFTDPAQVTEAEYVSRRISARLGK